MGAEDSNMAYEEENSFKLGANPAFTPVVSSPDNTPGKGGDTETNPFQSTLVWPPRDPNAVPIPGWVRIINAGTETCVFKGAISGIAGGGLGLMLGLFFGGYASAVDKAVEMDGPTSAKLRVGMREAWRAMTSYGKNFARFGLLYSVSECAVEKFRAKHDMVNPVLGGCAAGAAMAAAPYESIPIRARAIQMGIGCASVAAFSAAIDYYMEYME